MKIAMRRSCRMRRPPIINAVERLLLQVVGTMDLNVDEVVRSDHKIQVVRWKFDHVAKGLFEISGSSTRAKRV